MVRKLTELANEDLRFLKKLDIKLHRVRDSTYTPNISGEPFSVSVDTYTDKKMNSKEIKKVLKLADKGSLIFYPINTACGFEVGFEVAISEPILKFKESQLPENYDFKRVSKTFMKKENIARASLIGVKIINNRNHYDY